jgi:hypothetical protein
MNKQEGKYLIRLHILLPYVLLQLPCLACSSSPPRIHPHSLTVLLVKAEGVQDKHVQLCVGAQFDLLLQLLGAAEGCCCLPAL